MAAAFPRDQLRHFMEVATIVRNTCTDGNSADAANDKFGSQGSEMLLKAL